MNLKSNKDWVNFLSIHRTGHYRIKSVNRSQMPVEPGRVIDGHVSTHVHCNTLVVQKGTILFWIKHLNCIETFHQYGFDCIKNFTSTYSFSENNNFYVPPYWQWPGSSINCKWNLGAPNFIINCIQISSVLLVYQTAFDYKLIGNLFIILCALVHWRYSRIRQVPV